MKEKKSDVVPVRRYTTEDEIAFLKSLPQYRIRHGLTRIELLRRYAQAVARRQRWGLIDPDVVRNYLQLEIGQPIESQKRKGGRNS